MAKIIFKYHPEISLDPFQFVECENQDSFYGKNQVPSSITYSSSLEFTSSCKRPFGSYQEQQVV